MSYPLLILVDMEATSLRFAAAARTLGLVARRQGLVAPGFRSPPRLDGVERTLRRRRDGNATVSVRLKGRPWVAVLADMIDGVLAANRLEGAEATRLRTTLWTAVEGEATAPRGDDGGASDRSPSRRGDPRARTGHLRSVPPPHRAA